MPPKIADADVKIMGKEHAQKFALQSFQTANLGLATEQKVMEGLDEAGIKATFELELFSKTRIVRSSESGVAGLAKQCYANAPTYPPPHVQALVDITIRTLYKDPQDGEEYIIPAVLIDYGALLDLDLMSEFRAISDSLAQSGETPAQASERKFGHGLRVLMLFSGCYMLTQGVRKSDIQSRSAHASIRQLISGSSTSKYFGAAATAALVSGQSTKSMTSGAANFAGAISCTTYFWSAYLFAHPSYVYTLAGTEFLQSYMLCTCKKGPGFFTLSMSCVR